jgi:hypothetical protein
MLAWALYAWFITKFSEQINISIIMHARARDAKLLRVNKFVSGCAPLPSLIKCCASLFAVQVRG